MIESKRAFLDAAQEWLCDGYSTDIRFIGASNTGEHHIWDALILINPLPSPVDNSFSFQSEGFLIGQVQGSKMEKAALLRVLEAATEGTIEIPGKTLRLAASRPLSFYSEMAHRDRWFSDLHLQVGGGLPAPTAPERLAAIDNLLRRANPPFDGLSDAAIWLGLAAPGTGAESCLKVRANPPVDMVFDKSSLAGDQLRITMHAHPQFDVSRVGLAVRAAPGKGIESRRQIAQTIAWADVSEGKREGVAAIRLDNADGALAMLLIGSDLVRRQWFVDPDRARNHRLVAAQCFDRDLRMTRRAVLESEDPARFENGIAALLFLLGFSPAVQLETDSPDLIVATPAGRLVIVECTTRIADFSAKVGKLVDRRGALVKALQASGHPSQISSALVCRLPRDQIAARREEPWEHGVILITGEELIAAFDRARFANNPDEMLEGAEAALQTPFS